jgi:hypothetical protein
MELIKVMPAYGKALYLPRNGQYLLSLSASELALLVGEADHARGLRRMPTLTDLVETFQDFAAIVDEPAFRRPVPPDGRVPAAPSADGGSAAWPPAPLTHVLGVGSGV